MKQTKLHIVLFAMALLPLASCERDTYRYLGKDEMEDGCACEEQSCEGVGGGCDLQV